GRRRFVRSERGEGGDAQQDGAGGEQVERAERHRGTSGPGSCEPARDGRPTQAQPPSARGNAAYGPRSDRAGAVPIGTRNRPRKDGEATAFAAGGRPPAQPIRALWPPSTGSATPVMKRASSEARNSAAQATSQAA